jgi:hypothetical protein
MNRIAFALVLAAAAAGNAFADDITIESTPFQSTLTTAQVQAELAQYKKAGVNPWAQSYNPLKEVRSQVSSAQVTAEYIRSRDAVAAMTGEDSGSSYLARHDDVQGSTVAGQPVNAQ